MRLKEMYNNREVSPEDMCTIYVVLKVLDEYDRNILIAYYELADSRTCVLSRLLGVSPAVINHRLKSIKSKTRKMSKNMFDSLCI